MVELPEGLRPRFVAAGWHPGRRVDVSANVATDHPAAAVLAEFGGLTVTSDRVAGEECGTAILTFQELWPDGSIAEVWGELLKTRLIGIADLYYGHGELYIGADGRCFGRSCIHDAFYFQGESFGKAAERALLGRKARPLLRPNQPSVRLYGVRFTSDSPEVYRYR